MFVTLKTENSNMRSIKAVPASASQGQAGVLLPRLTDECLLSRCRPSGQHGYLGRLNSRRCPLWSQTPE